MNKATQWRPENRLLAMLPAEVCARLKNDLQLVPLVRGKVLFEAQAQQHQMYFVRTGVVSLVYGLENGDTGEIAMIGNEGVVGTAVLIDDQSAPGRAVVQVPGEAYCLKSDKAGLEFRRSEEFQQVVLRYTQVLIGQMAQTAICNRHHTIEKQLCRWLLSCRDRIEGDELHVTQETIANYLGVRREAVTEAARRLQDAQCIRYTRGNIQIIDRNELKRRSCECYALMSREYVRLMVPQLPTNSG
jgi:CRP-like cAMP-binding protein